MQGFHQSHLLQQPQPQQQQFAALLSAALPKDVSSTSSSPIPPSSGGATASGSLKPAGSNDDERGDSARLAAIDSLHRAILYPPNSLLVAHSASFLSQGLAQLLVDRCYPVRYSAAATYGALCAVFCSAQIGHHVRPNAILLGNLPDRFIGWALPMLKNANAKDGTTELSVEGLREFLTMGDVVGIERFVLPILKACQAVLEDERTSFSLLQRILDLLALISVKFSRIFNPLFLDIVDLLLGWVLVPDLPDSDRRVVLDSFLQFQKQWAMNLQFSVGLLSKFLGDMEALLQDGNLGTPSKFQRLLSLLSCFCTVLQSTASGLLDVNLLNQITGFLSKLIPQLLRCLSAMGNTFGWLKWMDECWKCLTLLAEILGESFRAFYPLAVDILFQKLRKGDGNQAKLEQYSSMQAHRVLKTNLQLLSLQKNGLDSSAVKKNLHFDSPVSQLRLHPNHLVTGSAAATYIFLLQHSNEDIVSETIAVLIGELQLLKDAVTQVSNVKYAVSWMKDSQFYFKDELFSLLKFDLKVLISSLSNAGFNFFVGEPEKASVYRNRSELLSSVIITQLNPFDLPINSYLELQVIVLKALERVAVVEFISQFHVRKLNMRATPDGENDAADDKVYALAVSHIRKYQSFLTLGLNASSPLTIKLAALHWIERFAEMIIFNHQASDYSLQSSVYGGMNSVVFSVLDAASDKEPRVRLQAPLSLSLLLQARLIDPVLFPSIAVIVLEKLSDPEVEVKQSFINLLSYILPLNMCANGFFALSPPITGATLAKERTHIDLHWKQVFSLRQLNKKLQSQQLVTVLSYISQRWKVPLSSWVHRLIHSCKAYKEQEEGPQGDHEILWDIKPDDDVLENVSSVNNLAGAWWAVQEAARYCITTRLRTNLGGPTQTFAALERMLLDVSHVLELDIDQNDENLSIIGSSGARLLPMRLLLDFVEALKKNVFNAYEGSAILHPPPRQSSLFLRGNRKVCEEWFSRICEPMMNAGISLQCHDATIEYCSLRLQELKLLWASLLKDNSAQASENLRSLPEDVSRILRNMTLALCRNHEADALLGLKEWASSSFSAPVENERQMIQSGELGNHSWISGLVYQAEAQYERAAAHFINVLQNDESATALGSDGIQFVISRIIECYTCLSDWNSLDNWLQELQALRSKNTGKSLCGAYTTAGNEINAIHALARFDAGEYKAAWAFLDLTPKSFSDLTLDPKLARDRSEQLLLHAMLHYVEGNFDKVQSEAQRARSMMKEILSVLPLDGLEEAAPYTFQLHCILLLEEISQLKDNHVNLLPKCSLLNHHSQLLLSHLGQVNQDCRPWLNVLRIHRISNGSFPQSSMLALSLSRLARKQGNHRLSSRLIVQTRDALMKCSKEGNFDFLFTCLQYEEILLMYSEKMFEDALTKLWSFVVSKFSLKSVKERCVKAKAYLKLFQWLKEDYPSFNLENFVSKVREGFENDSGSYSLAHERIDPKGNPDSNLQNSIAIENLVGMAAKSSTELCPAMGKAWICYADWCFSRAANFLACSTSTAMPPSSFFSAIDPEVQSESINLTPEEGRRVESVLSELYGEHVNKINGPERDNELLLTAEDRLDNNDLNGLVQQVIGIIETAARAPGVETSNFECLSDSIASSLRSFMICKYGIDGENLSSAVLGLVDVWWSLRKRLVSVFGYAANGFAQSLRYFSSASFDVIVANQENQAVPCGGGSYFLKAILHLLHIMVNYGAELSDVIETALSVVPLTFWQEIIPQLFARLSSHPELVVRKQLEALLMLLAKQFPSSIVFPTLVDVNTSEQPSMELHHIFGCLKELYPRLTNDVQLTVNELENVTVLWEELWLSTIQDLHADVVRRINVLKEEAARIAENSTLSLGEKSRINAAKYSAMMSPIVVALERRLASTSRKPETPHELWFVEQYRDRLASAIIAFKRPPASLSALGYVWRPFEDFAASLTSFQRKSAVSLEEVAPRLSALSSSSIPMPGLEKQRLASEGEWNPDRALEGIVTILSFRPEVSILSTKTKPKKVVMIGSDGNSYTYLLKGREDLRLDARIMQFVQAVKGYLNSKSWLRKKLLSIRTYTVTPISDRAGLIQWVNNVVSVYSVFKAWQNRVHAAQNSSSGSNQRSSFPSVLRPSDMFYGKIIPALKEHGIRRAISRKDWPQDVKRKVLLDLMSEVPKNLLQQELWCASEGFKAFNHKLKRFSGSVAAMSMVGHILGLGDRHLDNILVDICSGEIVHIDYNICFDKGQRLKIPELVPFRLTQVVEGSLGLTGVEGAFRANCESVINVLRENKDVLRMLLEVFVWDPLIEWTRKDFHDDAAIGGEERKGMESAVRLSLFASRFHEFRVPLQEHRDMFLSTLPAVEFSLQRFADALNEFEAASSIFVRAEQELANVIFQESSAKSILAEATNNLEKCRMSLEVHAREYAQAKTIASEIAQNSAKWMEQHGRLLNALKMNLLPDANVTGNLSNAADDLSLTSAVLVAGAPLSIIPDLTMNQCQDIDRETLKSINDLDHAVSSTQMEIQRYSLALRKVLPLNYISTSSLHSWAQVLHRSATASSTETLSLARLQAVELIRNPRKDSLDNVTQIHDELCRKLEKFAQEIEKIDSDCTATVNSIGSDPEVKSRDQLLSAFRMLVQPPSATAISQRITQDHKVPRLSLQPDKLLSMLNVSMGKVYNNVKVEVHNVIGDIQNATEIFNAVSPLLEEQVEKCLLVSSLFDEFEQLLGEYPCPPQDDEGPRPIVRFPAVIKTILFSCSNLIGKMTDIIVDFLHYYVTKKPDVVGAFGFISQIRGSVDMALKRLLEIRRERASLTELEDSYYAKVGFITEKKLALEEAAGRVRDNLSWEEADELSSQEEAFKTQLNELHVSWDQRQLKSSSLIKTEDNVKECISASELHFRSQVSAEGLKDPFLLESKALLSLLDNLFDELESAHREASSLLSSSLRTRLTSDLETIANSGNSLSNNVWIFGNLLDNNLFFIWKLCVLDTFINLCFHELTASTEQNRGFDQLLNDVKEKVETKLEEHIGRYLKEWVVPTFLAWLNDEIERLKCFKETEKNTLHEQTTTESPDEKKIQLMFEEYCGVHESARAARSVASAMKRSANKLTLALKKTAFELVLLEWMHDYLIPLQKKKFEKFFSDDANAYSAILSLSRSQLLESMNSSATKLATLIDYLQVCEQNSVRVEVQLERAVSWAYGPLNSSKVSGMPPVFHEHLIKRRQMLRETREKASDIVKTCLLILEFEASRDGIYRITGEYPLNTGDGRSWQQSYLSIIAKMEVTHHSFACAEKEWELAESTAEAASKRLNSATNELSYASAKANSTSGDMQKTVITMTDSAYEASIALAACDRLLKDHTALTTESGMMLDEVLAITEDLLDVHKLSREAATMHRSLMENLSKVHAVVLPLEAVLSTDVAAMADTITKDRENRPELLAIHGRAIYQSYHLKINEAIHTLKPLIDPFKHTVEALYSLLMKLARTASLRAGHLHKALEGLVDRDEAEFPDVKLDNVDDTEVNNKEKESGMDADLADERVILSDDMNNSSEKGWLSPPDSVRSGESISFVHSNNGSATDDANLREEVEALSVGHLVLDDRINPLSDSNNDTHSNGRCSPPSSQSSVAIDELRPRVSQSIVVEDGKESHLPYAPITSRVTRGKNAFATSALKKIEMKIDGRDISDQRAVSTAEQVDYLIKQAMSIDNLCNMYEGWTPWI